MRRWVAVAAALGAAFGAVPARAAAASQDVRVKMSDGVELQATVSGQAPLAARPVVVEISPYGRGTATYTPPPAYNSLLVQTRGTGDSDGSFDALGPRTQRDVVDVLNWACGQPWSDGNLAVNGFSASAITIYNALHQHLPCVKAMLLKSGTYELYRDLLVPGGVNNMAPGVVVIATISGAALAQGADRLRRDPSTGVDVAAGLMTSGLSDLQHPTLDAWWRERGWRGNVNHIPALVIDGFFDVESRGAFEGFRALAADGAHLLVIGGHDGAPKGTDGGGAAMTAWLDHHLRGIDNGVDRQPKVQLWMSDGDREDFIGGRFVTAHGDDWPLPGTRWVALALDARRSGSARSINDGSLALSRPAATTLQAAAALPSLPTNTDVPTTGAIGAAGFNALSGALPILTDMTVAGALGLSYTTPKLTRDVVAAGPAGLEVRLRSTAPETAIWAVISDVDDKDTPHPLTVGRLSTAFPDVDATRSLQRSGEIVQPYGDFSTRKPAAPGQERAYRVELWPVGNRFRAGHRIRLDIVGQSAFSLPGVPAVNAIRVGGPNGARLLFPVAPGSDLRAAASTRSHRRATFR
jgi:putative CocE/NonD family hydrolase